MLWILLINIHLNQMIEIRRPKGITKKDIEKVEKALAKERMELFGTLPFKGVKRHGHGKKA